MISVSQPTPPSTSPTILVTSHSILYRFKNQSVSPICELRVLAGFLKSQHIPSHSHSLTVASSFDSFVFDFKSIQMSRNNYRYYFVKFCNNTNIVFDSYGADKRNIHNLTPLTHTHAKREREIENIITQLVESATIQTRTHMASMIELRWRQNECKIKTTNTATLKCRTNKKGEKSSRQETRNGSCL